MTYEEALYSLCEDCVHYPCYALKHGDNCSAYNTIKKSIEKQIPKKVISIENLCVCPSCGAMLETKRMNIARGNIGCPCCLQVIDWGEEE